MQVAGMAVIGARRSGRLAAAVLTILASSVGVLTVQADLSPARAATCTGTGCDNKGPQGAGCFPDHVVRAAVADGAGTRVVTLRYSPSCHAFWAYAANPPASGTAEVQFEMQQKNANGVYVTRERLFAYLDAGEGADWTNALGARNGGFRFRAIYVKPNGATFFTDWVTGGQQ